MKRLVVAGSIVGMLVIGIGITCLVNATNENRNSAERITEAYEQSNSEMETDIDEKHAELDSLTKKWVAMVFGDDSARLWEKCQTPPKDPAHIKACKALNERITRYEKAQADKQDREAAKW